jgi:FkbH-like protein
VDKERISVSGSEEYFLQQPLDGLAVLRKKRSLRRGLLEQTSDRRPLRVAILAGSTTGELRDMLELFLLDAGIEPTFYETDYDRVFEEAMFDQARLDEFRPELIYVHTTYRNLKTIPAADAESAAFSTALDAETDRYAELWECMRVRYGCPVVQNNFEMPPLRRLGNLDAFDAHGESNFILELNRRLALAAQDETGLYLHDLNYLAASFGLCRWHDEAIWALAKSATSQEAIPHLAQSVARVVRTIYGGSRKVLVLDLDNTLWGGIIGEDGPENIRLGQGNAEGETYSAFQSYVLELKRRGVILAVCSKNDEEIALEGLQHPDSLLSRDDFAAFIANWEPKALNIRQIAEMLEVGSDSLVFIDDNPVERAAVRAQAPEVTVPEVDADPLSYLKALDQKGFFDLASYSQDDLSRSDYYRKNAQRRQHADRFESYEQFLSTLEMEGEIEPFSEINLPRIVQLINKTNQFNLTTQRMTEIEVKSFAASRNCITLSGRLADRFGDNGLISVLIASVDGKRAHIDNWLMSCRVLRRGFEDTMLDLLVEKARAMNVETLEGHYIPTRKNGMVKDLYKRLGFELMSEPPAALTGESRWELHISKNYETRNRWIRVKDGKQQTAPTSRTDL